VCLGILYAVPRGPFFLRTIAQMGVECEVFESDHVNISRYPISDLPLPGFCFTKAQDRCGIKEPEPFARPSELDSSTIS